MPKMEIIRSLPSATYLRECFVYDPASGELRWKERPRDHFVRPVDFVRCNAMAGEVAGYHDKGYLRVSLGGVDYRAHRLVWKLVTGRDPSLMLDHKDGNRANNRWANLREATQGEQTQNSKLRKDNRSGRRGVLRASNGKGWRAVIAGRYLGDNFSSVEAASAAYETAARELFGAFYRPPRER
jgi:hypothetical protein